MIVQQIEPNVGHRIRELRKRRGLTLRGLAGACGLSANAISLIERGENSPTVSSLHQLATALDVSIADLFKDADRLSAVYVQHDRGLRYKSDCGELESLGSGLSNQQLEPFRMVLKPGLGRVSTPIAHPGQEFIYCLEGVIEYYVKGQRYRLEAGDSLLFESENPHFWRNVTDSSATILMIFQANHSRHLARQRHLES
jgi:transcriptional regulator with XRE-family HTH domain